MKPSERNIQDAGGWWQRHPVLEMKIHIHFTPDNEHWVVSTVLADANWEIRMLDGDPRGHAESFSGNPPTHLRAIYGRRIHKRFVKCASDLRMHDFRVLRDRVAQALLELQRQLNPLDGEIEIDAMVDLRFEVIPNKEDATAYEQAVAARSDDDIPF